MSDSPVLDEITFSEFLQLLENRPVNSAWVAIATALGVSRVTLRKWRQMPEAKEAIARGIRNSIDKMVETGADDWRMWREHLKILGVKEETTTKHEIGEGVTEMLDALELGSGKLKEDYAELGQKASEQILENDPLVQNQGQVGQDSDVQPERDPDSALG